MTAPRTYAISRMSRRGGQLGVALLGFLGVGSAALGWLGNFGADAAFARPFFGVAALFFAGIAYVAARSGRAAAAMYNLRADGIEYVPAEGMPQFIGWNQVIGLRLARIGGYFELSGPGEQVLLKISVLVEGLGELLNVVMAKAILPKRRTALPFEAEKRYPAAAIIVLLALVALVAAGAIAIYQDTGSLAGLALPAVLGLFLLAERLFTPRTIVIDQRGVTIRRVVGEKFLAWEVLQGGALAILRGPKGSIGIGAVVRRRDGTWQGLRLEGVDPMDLLAAIAASGPDRIIPAPDRLMLSGPSAFGATYREPQKIFSFLKK